MNEVAAVAKGRFVIPDVVASHFHIRPGDTAADIGSGTGYFTKTLARLVGPEGKVYSVDVQKNLVEANAELAQREGLGNVEVIWGDCEAPQGCKINSDEVDVTIMVNTVFQLEDIVAAFTEMKRILRPGGKLIVIDWSESFGGLGPQPDQVVSAGEAEAAALTAGFTKETTFDAGDHHYGISFRL